MELQALKDGKKIKGKCLFVDYVELSAYGVLKNNFFGFSKEKVLCQKNLMNMIKSNYEEV